MAGARPGPASPDFSNRLGATGSRIPSPHYRLAPRVPQQLVTLTAIRQASRMIAQVLAFLQVY